MNRLVDLGDVRLNVEDRGAGRPLIARAWLPARSLDVAGADRCICSEGFRVIAPDLRGFGGSELGAAPVTMSLYADDLNRLLDSLGVTERIVYCGLSMGGYIGWQFWNHFSSRLAALVQCDTRAVGDTPQAKAGRAELAARVMAVGPQAAAEAMMPKLFAPSAGASGRLCRANPRGDSS